MDDKKWEVFKRREVEIQHQLYKDSLLYGAKIFQINTDVSFWDKIKCLFMGGSPYIKRIEPLTTVMEVEEYEDISLGNSVIAGDLEVNFYNESKDNDELRSDGK